MDKNINDIHNLGNKSRILAAITGRGYPALARQPDKADLEAIPADSEPDGEAIPPLDEANDAPDLPGGAALAPYSAASVLSVPEEQRGRYVLAAFLASRASPRTRKTMRVSCSRMARLLGTTPDQVPWHRLRFEHTNALRGQLLSGGYATSTVALTLEALKGVLRTARRMHLLTRDEYEDATEWDPLRIDILPAGRELSAGELEKIARYLFELDGGAYAAFNRAAFALMLGAGLRAIETCRVTVEGYDTSGALSLVRKGGKRARVPISATECKALDAWLAARAPFVRRLGRSDLPLLLRVHRNDWVRESAAPCSERYLRELCAKVAVETGIPHFGPHDLRRTFCTRALRRFDPNYVQDWMGHAKPETTRRYDRRTEEERAAARRSWNIWGPDQPPSSPAGLLVVARAND